jgi:hypothetical protein
MERRLRHLAAMVRHLAASATFSGVATYNGATYFFTVKYENENKRFISSIFLNISFIGIS